MANPNAGEPEWVELSNQTDQPLDLSGYKLDNSQTGGAFTLPIGSTLSAGETRRFTLPHAMLNNEGDTLRLLGPNGDVATSSSFAAAAKGQALCLEGAQARPCPASTPTPAATALRGIITDTATLEVAAPGSTQGIMRKISSARPYGSAGIGKRYMGLEATSVPESAPVVQSTHRTAQALPKQQDSAPQPGLLLLCLGIIAGCAIFLTRSYWTFSQRTSNGDQE